MSSPLANPAEKENGAAVLEDGRELDHPAAAMQNGGYESERRAQRRQRHELEKEEAKQWDIIKGLSVISAEVELLTQEVCLSLYICESRSMEMDVSPTGSNCRDSSCGSCLTCLQRYGLRSWCDGRLRE